MIISPVHLPCPCPILRGGTASKADSIPKAVHPAGARVWCHACVPPCRVPGGAADACMAHLVMSSPPYLVAVCAACDRCAAPLQHSKLAPPCCGRGAICHAVPAPAALCPRLSRSLPVPRLRVSPCAFPPINTSLHLPFVPFSVSNPINMHSPSQYHLLLCSRATCLPAPASCPEPLPCTQLWEARLTKAQRVHLEATSLTSLSPDTSPLSSLPISNVICPKGTAWTKPSLHQFPVKKNIQIQSLKELAQLVRLHEIINL